MIPYECELCKDDGWIYSKENGELKAAKCKCQIQKEIEHNIENCGLTEFFKKRTFDNYAVKNDVQKNALNRAKDFVNSDSGNLLLCGQIGSGKTHLGAAALLKLAKKNNRIRYVSYSDMVRRIGDAAREEGEYFNEIGKYMHVRVLMIDDMYKGRIQKDTHLLYLTEIINYRYERGYRTIITTEKTMKQLFDIDEAIASRLFEGSSRFVVSMDGTGNYRMSAGVI